MIDQILGLHATKGSATTMGTPDNPDDSDFAANISRVHERIKSLKADIQAAERERDDALSALDKCKERLGDLQREQGNKGRSDNGLRARVTAAVAQLRSAKDGNQAKAIRSALATLAPASDHSTLDHE
jgi:chromosome segregation ATPase